MTTSPANPPLARSNSQFRNKAQIIRIGSPAVNFQTTAPPDLSLRNDLACDRLG